MKLKHFTFLLFVCSIAQKSFSQTNVVVGVPLERTVLQRQSNDYAPVFVSGSYTLFINSVEVQLTALNGGISVPWTSIVSNPAGGFFKGSVNVYKGWYKLEARGMLNGVQVGSIHTVQKVGVGEVFIVAGQSNGQGVGGSDGSLAAVDDRVNTVDYTIPYVSCPGPNFNCGNPQLPFPSYSQLSFSPNLSPNGNSSWCWGKLGDLISARINAPVVFFNAAAGGSGVYNWSKSAYNQLSNHYFFNSQFGNNVEIPYVYLNRSLKNYASFLGARAVLWHQGESDAKFPNAGGSTINRTIYKDELKKVIDKSRADYGRQIPWVVAKATYFQGITDAEIINGQNDIRAASTQVFEGPNTDGIQPRPDDVHLTGAANLTTLASAWDTWLSNSFFTASTPQAAREPLSVAVSCPNNGGNLTFTAQAGFATYYWVNGNNSFETSFSNAQAVTLGQGTYRVYGADANGNLSFSTPIVVPANPYPVKPVISPAGPITNCSGGTVTLTSNSSNVVNVWSTGSNAQSIGVATSGNYTVTSQNVFGCNATSDPVAVTAGSSSGPPTITPSGTNYICQSGGSLTLTSSSPTGNIWSTGETTQSIVVSTTGNYSVTVSGGCGNTSASTTVIVSPAVVASASPSSIVYGQTTTLTASNCSGTVNWNNGAGSGSSVVVQPTANVTYLATCASTGCSGSVAVAVNQCPPAHSITTTINSTSPTTEFRAANTVVATNRINSGNIIYRAGGSVTLNPGFRVEPGTVFRAYVQGCP